MSGKTIDVFLDFSTNSISNEKTLFLKAVTLSFADCVSLVVPSCMLASSFSNMVISSTS